MSDARTIELGGHAFHFQFWRDIETQEKPPIFKCSVFVDVAVTFDIHVIVGAAHDDATKERFLNSYRRVSPARTIEEIQDGMLGLTFSGLRFDGLEDFGPEASREVYISAAGDDLFVFSYSINRASNPHEDAWRRQLLTLVAITVTQVGPTD